MNLPPDYDIVGPIGGPFSVRIGYRKKRWWLRTKTTWVRPLFVKSFETLEDARQWCAEHCRQHMGKDIVQESYAPHNAP